MRIASIAKPLIFSMVFFAFAIAQNDTATAIDSTSAITAPAETVAPAAQQTAAPLSARIRLQLFAPAQFDSVLGLLPGGDSLRSTGNIVSIAEDPVTGELFVIFLDAAGTPEKLTFPKTSLTPRPESLSETAPPFSIERSQNGRTWFIIESTVKSALIYPLGFNNAFSRINGQTLAGVSLITIGGTLYGTYAFTRNLDLGYGKVGLMNYGSTLFGSYYPALIAAFLTGTTDLENTYATKTDWYGNEVEFGPSAVARINAWCSIVGFPLGILIGSKSALADRDDFGKVAVMEYFSQTLGAIGFALPLFVLDPAINGDAYLTTSSLLGMALLPAGIAAGKAWCGNSSVSAGRGSLPWVSGLLGTATGVAIPALFDYDNINPLTIARIYTTTGLIGYGTGTWLGLNYHPEQNYSYWQTVFIGASSCAGALMGIALPLIGQMSDRQPYIIAGTLGAWTGFYLGEKLSLALFEKSSRDRHSSAVKFNLPGLAMAPIILAAGKNHRSNKSALSVIPAMPMANLEWRF